MESNIRNFDASFGVSGAGAIFLFVLLAEVLDDILVAMLLNSTLMESLLSLQGRDENAISAMRRSLGGVVGTLLMFGITVGALKAYFPRHSIRSLFVKFGFLPIGSTQALVASLLGGISLVLVFERILISIFPPPIYAAVHPASVINFGTTLDKLIFVFGAVVLAPIAEELLFRGVLYRGLLARFHYVVAGALVTLCFIFIHPEVISTGYWLTHALLYLTACMLMVIREISGTLSAGIMFHVGVNFAALML